MLTAVPRTGLMMGVVPDWWCSEWMVRRALPCLKLELELELLEAASGLRDAFSLMLEQA
jgi:hypothetical protein